MERSRGEIATGELAWRDDLTGAWNRRYLRRLLTEDWPRLACEEGGVTLLALATSLPEISTTTAAARNGNYEAAFGNIFGSNAFNVVLLVLVAALAGGAATLEAMSASTRFAAALGILLTSIYLWGLLERDDRTVLRMGWDSAAVVVIALAGFAVMYWLE